MFIAVKIDKFNGHDDLVLLNHCGEELACADTYYLVIDSLLYEKEESFERVLKVLIKLLSDWISQVEGATEKNAIYLPFDFSDQYIGCLKICKLNSSSLYVYYGYTKKMEGHSIRPSNTIPYFLLNDDDFILEIELGETSQSDFIRDLETSIKELEAL